MANDQPFRWRTVLEIGALSAVIYIILGAPGFPVSLLSAPTSLDLKVSLARAKIENLVYPSQGLECKPRELDIHIFSTSPLVIYISNFLSAAEADHLVAISGDKWQRSTVFNAGVEVADDTVRKSDKALIPRDDVVQCVEARALGFQGWPRSTYIERLWTQRYNVSGHYALHYDWAMASKESRRVSTFMVYLATDCEGGGTHFPKLDRPGDGRWCEYVECEGQDGQEGVTFRPRKGAAVFWMNFDPDGKGYKETIHAGMPVKSGTKIGLNIWSWYQEGHVAPTDQLESTSNEDKV